MTVIVACITLAILIILMGSSTGIFVHKIKLTTYFNNAEGLRDGAAVRVEGVDVGNVTKVGVVPGEKLPVKVTMKVTTKYGDAIRKTSLAGLSTAGVLGETFVDINSINRPNAPAAVDGDVLLSEDRPGIQDVVKSSQTTLDNVNVLIVKLNTIVDTISSGQGSLGKILNDPSLFNRANETLGQLQKIADQIENGKGSIGKLLASDEIYEKLNGTVDHLNALLDGIEKGEGTAGKLVKDPSLYNNANAMTTKANALIDEINAGHGTLGMLLKDQAFANKLNATMTRVQAISERLDNGEGSAGKLLKDPSLYNNTDQMLVESRNLIKAIRQDPKKYLTIHLKLF